VSLSLEPGMGSARWPNPWPDQNLEADNYCTLHDIFDCPYAHAVSEQS
jgi:hypothetical protein